MKKPCCKPMHQNQALVLCSMAARQRTASVFTCQSSALCDVCGSGNPTAPALLGGLFRGVHRLPKLIQEHGQTAATWRLELGISKSASSAARWLVLQRGGLRYPEEGYRKDRALLNGSRGPARAFIGLPESFAFEASNFAARKSWSQG